MNYRSLAMAALCGVAFGAQAADATWKAAVDGNWSEPTNWVNDTPPTSADNAVFGVKEAAYAVTLNAVGATTVKGLIIDGKETGGCPTKLSVTSPLVIDGSPALIGYGSVDIGSGGSVELKNVIDTSYIRRGGQLVVDGGDFIATNACTASILSIGNSKDWLSNGAPRFSIKSGNVYLAGSKVLLYSSSSYYGDMEMTGGKLTLIDTSLGHNAMLCYLESNSNNGNIFKMTGDAEIELPNGGSFTLGRGVSTIEGNAKIAITSSSDNNSMTFGPYSSDSGCASTINLGGNSQVVATGLRSFNFGRNSFRVQKTTGAFNISGGEHQFGIHSDLGTGIGTYQTTITGGEIEFTGYGLRIGGTPYVAGDLSHSGAVCLSCTSTVTVAGGTLNCSASKNHYSTPSQNMLGFVVGAGLTGYMTKKYTILENGWTEATLNITGGAVTNGLCPKLIGVGNALGKVVQTGGTFSSDGIAGGNQDRDALVIGAFSGEGIYTMSGGTANFNCPLYVGGISTKLLQRSNESNELPTNGSGELITGQTKGTLSISGGTMSVLRDSVVGYDGEGKIEMSGNGSLTFGGNLLLTNTVGSAKLSLALGSTTAPTFKVNGKLVIGSGSVLEVDASQLSSSVDRIKLIDCATRSGEFTESNCIVTGDTSLKVRHGLGSDAASIYLVRRRGMAIIFY